MPETRTVSIGNVKLNEIEKSLSFGTDAIMLAAYIKRESRHEAVELGAGTGVISLILAKEKAFSHIYDIEIQEELSNICSLNIRENELDGIITPINSDLRDINYSNFDKVKVVFANPPYMKEESGKKSESASRQICRHEVFGGIYEFCKCASGILKTGGKFYCVYRPDRLESLMDALKKNSLAPKRMTFVSIDEKHSPSSVLIEAVKDGKESLYLTPVMYLQKDGMSTDNSKTIYNELRFAEEFFNIKK